MKISATRKTKEIQIASFLQLTSILIDYLSLTNLHIFAVLIYSNLPTRAVLFSVYYQSSWIQNGKLHEVALN